MAQDLPIGFESREQLSALSSTAAFLSILPTDAPQEIRASTIDVKDVRSVYKIYQASRRHNFQILVERFILQIRYGCRDERCTTPTCDTSRRRTAGPRPIRRYNATSARNLACYLAIEDNPARNLCPYVPILDSSKVKIQKPAKTRTGFNKPGNLVKDSDRIPKSPQPVVAETESAPLDARTLDNPDASKSVISEYPLVDNRVRIDTSLLPALPFDQPVKKDHKSFVQNMFDTVSFKMLEWMTPNYLEATIDSEALRYEMFSEMETSNAIPFVSTSKGAFGQTQGVPETGSNKTTAALATISSTSSEPTTNPPNTLEDRTPPTSPKSRRSGQTSADELSSHRRAQETDDIKSLVSPTRQLNGIIPDESVERNENGRPRSNMRHIRRSGASQQDLQKSPTYKSLDEPKSPKISRRISQPTFDSLRLPYGEPLSNCLPSTQNDTAQNLKKASLDSQLNGKPVNPTPPIIRKSYSKSQQKSNESTNLEKPHAAVPLKSQSLSFLSIEVMEAMSEYASCGKLEETDGIPSLGESRQNTISRVKRRETLRKPLVIPYSSATMSQWKTFIEQSIFFVLGSPQYLLRTFTKWGQIYDTQTLWYCLLQLMNCSRSIVLNSLWISAGHLYVPPKHLWTICDWTRTSKEYGINIDVHYSQKDKASLLSLGLHALIAAVPLITDPDELSEIARIRASGSSSPGSRTISSQILQSCLAYEAIFTNDLALRLARRLFSAIPACRQFQHIMRLSIDESDEQLSNTDILEYVLKPLSFLNIDTSPILDFTPQDRQMHEKRAPLLLIDWARTILYQDWNGSAEVPADGCFGGALALIVALYHKRKSLPLGDNCFRADYFADRLSEVDMPVEWLSFAPNNKTVHLLDHPYLFSPGKLVTFFRSINFSRMSRSHERANMVTGHVEVITAPRLLMMDPMRRDNLYRRLRVSTAGYLVLEVSREHVLKDAFDKLWRREERELLRPLKIHLGEDDGEEGFDSGGVQQEFFRLVMAEALNPNYGVFATEEYTRMAWFQPGSPEPLYKFEMIGLIVSLAIYNGLTLPVTFPKALYRKLLGEPVTELHHISDGWTQLAGNLNRLLEWNEEKEGLVSDVFSRTYEFGVNSFGQHVSREMVAGATWPQFEETHLSGSIPGSVSTNPENVHLVDSKNRNEYVSDYIQWLTDISVRPQFEAFERGFNRCLAPQSLKLLDSDLLQSIVEGVQEIDIHELRRYVRYEGFSATHPTIKDFWSIVKRYDQDQKKKLLEFVTASDRLPVGGVKNLVFVIQKNGMEEMDGHLPTSYTCYGTLLLPEYSSKEILRTKLAMALENAKGFGFA